MSNHRPAARAAIRGLIQLLTDRSPPRQPRDFIADATRFPHREWQEPGDCPDWLAILLGVSAMAFIVGAIIFFAPTP